MSEPGEQINLTAPGTDAQVDDLASLLEGNPVSSFTSTIEQAVRQLSIELSAIRAERDGLRLELEGLRAQYDLLRQQLADRDRFASTVRELNDIVRSLTLPPGYATPAAQAAAAPEATPIPLPVMPAIQEPAWLRPPATPAPVWAAPTAAAAPEPTPAEDVDWTSYLAPSPTADDAQEAPAPRHPVPTSPDPAAWAAYLAGGEMPPAPKHEATSTAPTQEPAAEAPVVADVSWLPPTTPEHDTAVAGEPTAAFTLDDAPRQSQPASTAFQLPVIDGVWQLTDSTPQRRQRERIRLKTWAARVGSVLGALLILAILIVALGPKFLPYQTYFVRSGSMEPTIDVGDMIFLTRVDAADLSEGDIITFERPDRPDTMVTHRIVAIETTPEGKVFQTKGDANGSPDTWRVPAQGEGWKLAFNVPKVGYVFGYLGTPQARLALLAIPAVILGILSLVDIWKPSRKRAGSRRS